MSLEILREMAILLQDCREHIQREVESTPGRRAILRKIDKFDQYLLINNDFDMTTRKEVGND